MQELFFKTLTVIFRFSVCVFLCCTLSSNAEDIIIALPSETAGSDNGPVAAVNKKATVTATLSSKGKPTPNVEEELVKTMWMLEKVEATGYKSLKTGKFGKGGEGCTIGAITPETEEWFEDAEWSCEATAGTAGYYEITFTGKVQYTYRSTEAPNLERIEEESAEGKGEAVFVSVALDAPRYVQFSKDENAPTELTLSLSYSPSDLDTGTVSLGIPGMLQLKPIIDEESGEETTPPTSWNLENETEREAEKSVVCQAIKTGTGTATASHSCGAKDEKYVTVFNLDLVAPNVTEEDEETIGEYIAVNKRLALDIIIEPQIPDASISLSATGLEMYKSASGDEKLDGPWESSGEFPQTVYVSSDTPSARGRDKSCTLSLSAESCGASDTVNVTAVKVDITVAGLSESLEEDPGAFVRIKQRKAVTLKYWPGYENGLVHGKLLLSPGEGEKYKYHIGGNDASGDEELAVFEWDLSKGETPPENFEIEGLEPIVLEMLFSHDKSGASDMAKITYYETLVQVEKDEDAAERLPDVVQKPGYFKISRRLIGATEDQVAPANLSIGFNILEVYKNDKLECGKAGMGDDYSLQKTDENKSNPQAITFKMKSETLKDTPEEKIVHKTYSGDVSIPANKTHVCLKVNPSFDWKDEGEEGEAGETMSIFLAVDPKNPYTVDDGSMDIGDESELPRPDMSFADLEIKDGGIIKISTDSNNDGEINEADDDPSIKNHADHPGRLIEVNYDDDNENDKEDRTERPANFATADNPAALAGTAPSITVQNEDDLAEVKMKVEVFSLEPLNENSTPEVDVCFTSTVDLILWTTSTKGSHVHVGVDGDRDGRFDILNRLETLNEEQLLFERTFYVEGNRPHFGHVTLQADPTAGPTGSDTAKITAFGIDFVDSVPDYSLDTNTDSDNFFLRQHSPGGTADYLNLDIYYSILPAGIKIDDVKVKIYEGDMGANVKIISGVKDTTNKFKSGNGLQVKWDDVRDGAGAFRDVGFYTVQLEVKITGRTEIAKTPTGDADTRADWPGFQCKQRCLAIHDLVYKHRPVVRMGDSEVVAENGPVYPFSQQIVENYKLQKYVGIFGQAVGVAWPSPPANFSTYGSFLAAPAMPRRGDYDYKYHVLNNSIANDAAGASNHFIDILDSRRWCTNAEPALLHRGHISRGHAGGSYCFIQYWMYETASHAPYGVLLNAFWHEGDWEMVQLCIKMTGSKKSEWFYPHAATASQHYYGQTLPWRINKNGPSVRDQEYVIAEADGNQVKVYIAENAHATYFRVATFETQFHNCGTQIQYNAGFTSYDQISLPLKPQRICKLVPLNYKNEKGIGDWPGFWGEDGAPRGPFLREANTTTGKLNLQIDPVKFHNLCRKLIGGVPQAETEL